MTPEWSLNLFHFQSGIGISELEIPNKLTTVVFLRATAVPAGTAERVLAMAILSVRLSVSHDPVPIQAQMRDSGFSLMIA